MQRSDMHSSGQWDRDAICVRGFVFPSRNEMLYIVRFNHCRLALNLYTHTVVFRHKSSCINRPCIAVVNTTAICLRCQPAVFIGGIAGAWKVPQSIGVRCSCLGMCIAHNVGIRARGVSKESRKLWKVRNNGLEKFSIELCDYSPCIICK